MQLVILTNRRRRYLPDTLKRIQEMVTGWDALTIVDDSGDARWRATLAREYSTAEIVPAAAEPAGYTTAMRTVVAHMHGDVVAFWEEDFRPTEHIDLHTLAGILDRRPWLAQVALLRQPWYANEVAAGGVIEALQQDGTRFVNRRGVIEHRAFFTCNPSVWRRSVYESGWPNVPWSENAKRDQLRSAGYRFGMIPGVKVNHVGQRTGFGY